MRDISKACFGVHTRDLILNNSSLKIENRQITFPYLRETVNFASIFFYLNIVSLKKRLMSIQVNTILIERR